MSEESAFPEVEMGSEGCDAPAQGDGNLHRFVFQPPRASRAWTPWRGQLMRWDLAGSVWINQFLVLASHFFCLPHLSDALEMLLFWGYTQCSFWNNHGGFEG